MTYLKNKLHIDEIFDVIVVSYEVGSRKPGTAMFNKVVSQTHLRPAEILFYDDKQDNIASAEAFGMHGRVYKNIEQFKQDLAAVGIMLK
jgi:HAD superfamily hydrolase (TIGR01509 family)